MARPQGSIKLLFPAGREYSIVKGQKATLYHYSTTGFGDINGDGIPAAITSVKALDDSVLQWVSLRPDYQSNTELIPPQDSLIFLDGNPTFGSAVTVDATHLRAGQTYRFTVTSCTEPPVGGSGFRPCASVGNLSVSVLPIPISLLAATSPNGSYGTIRLFWKSAGDVKGIISRYNVVTRDIDSISVGSVAQTTILQPDLTSNDSLFVVSGKRSVQSWYSIAGFDSSGELVALSQSLQPVLRSGTFNQLNPPDGAIVTTQSLTLTWDGVSGEKFELWYGKDSTFASKVVVKNLVANSYHLPDTLDDHAVYYWQVKTTTGTRSNQAGWSFSFNRQNVPPQAAILIAPADGDSVHTAIPEFRWQAADDPGDSIGYQIVISSSSVFVDTILQAKVRQAGFNPLNPLQNANAFYWKVLAVDSRGAKVESAVKSFATDSPVFPQPFGLRVPLSNSGKQYFEFPTETSLQPKFQWDAIVDSSSGPLTYTLQYDTSVNFFNPVRIENLTGAAYDLTRPLLEDKRYYWNVEARNAAGRKISNSGLPSMFVTNVSGRDPDRATLVEPADGERFGVGGVLLSWENPADDFYDSHFFDVIVTTDTSIVDGGVPPVYSALFYQTSATFFPPQIATYFWRIRTRSVTVRGLSGGESYSAWRSFNFNGDLGTSVAESVVPRQFGLTQNYPNPFNPTTMIGYGLPRRSYVRIDVFNLVGEEIARLFDGVQDPGWHSLSWNAERFPSGVYYARMEWEGGTMSKKLVLIR